jgi:hypothetical protein
LAVCAGGPVGGNLETRDGCKQKLKRSQTSSFVPEHPKIYRQHWTTQSTDHFNHKSPAPKADRKWIPETWMSCRQAWSGPQAAKLRHLHRIASSREPGSFKSPCPYLKLEIFKSFFVVSSVKPPGLSPWKSRLRPPPLLPGPFRFHPTDNLTR